MALTRKLGTEAQVIVALDQPTVVPLDPTEKPTRLQEYMVSGTVSACFKGALRPPTSIRYGIFSEGANPRLAKPHIAFLHHAKGHKEVWTAVDGPIVEDTRANRRDIARVTSGCAK